MRRSFHSAIGPSDDSSIWRRGLRRSEVTSRISARAAAAAHVQLLLCGHVHRAKLRWHGEIAIGLNGQSGAEWAGRTIAYYDLAQSPVQGGQRWWPVPGAAWCQQLRAPVAVM